MGIESSPGIPLHVWQQLGLRQSQRVHLYGELQRMLRSPDSFQPLTYYLLAQMGETERTIRHISAEFAIDRSTNAAVIYSALVDSPTSLVNTGEPQKQKQLILHKNRIEQLSQDVIHKKRSTRSDTNRKIRKRERAIRVIERDLGIKG